MKKQLNTEGRYILGLNTRDGDGHVVSIEKIGSEIIIKDEQNNDFKAINSLVDIDYLELLKIDTLILNLPKVKSILGF